MRGNIVVAAAVFGLGVVLASVVLVVGVGHALDRAAGRLEGAVREHGRSVDRAGEKVGQPVGGALSDVSAALRKDGDQIEQAGKDIASARVTLTGPVQIRQPVMIQGTQGEEGSLPVNATLGKEPAQDRGERAPVE